MGHLVSRPRREEVSPGHGKGPGQSNPEGRVAPGHLHQATARGPLLVTVLQGRVAPLSRATLHTRAPHPGMESDPDQDPGPEPRPRARARPTVASNQYWVGEMPIPPANRKFLRSCFSNCSKAVASHESLTNSQTNWP